MGYERRETNQGIKRLSRTGEKGHLPLAESTLEKKGTSEKGGRGRSKRILKRPYTRPGNDEPYPFEGKTYQEKRGSTQILARDSEATRKSLRKRERRRGVRGRKISVIWERRGERKS